MKYENNVSQHFLYFSSFLHILTAEICISHTHIDNTKHVSSSNRNTLIENPHYVLYNKNRPVALFHSYIFVFNEICLLFLMIFFIFFSCWRRNLFQTSVRVRISHNLDVTIEKYASFLKKKFKVFLLIFFFS